jgi:hypothetical protein
MRVRGSGRAVRCPRRQWMPIEAGSGGELTIKVRHRDSKHPCAREPEPEAVFSDEQWAAIAKSISPKNPKNIPAEEQRDICIALMAYYHSLEDIERTAENEAEKKAAQRSKRIKIDRKAKGRKALEQFVYYAREFRSAIACIQYLLKEARALDKAERLTEDINCLQQIAQRELSAKSTSDRPASQARKILVHRLGVIYERITGDKPGLSNDSDGRPGGPFFRFVSTIFQFKNIPLKGIKHVISEVAGNAKNPH